MHEMRRKMPENAVRHFFKYSPKAKEIAARVEDAANKMEQEGFELVSCSIMPSSKGILVFKKSGAPAPEK